MHFPRNPAVSLSFFPPPSLHPSISYTHPPTDRPINSAIAFFLVLCVCFLQSLKPRLLQTHFFSLGQVSLRHYQASFYCPTALSFSRRFWIFLSLRQAAGPHDRYTYERTTTSERGVFEIFGPVQDATDCRLLLLLFLLVAAEGSDYLRCFMFYRSVCIEFPYGDVLARPKHTAFSKRFCLRSRNTWSLSSKDLWIDDFIHFCGFGEGKEKLQVFPYWMQRWMVNEKRVLIGTELMITWRSEWKYWKIPIGVTWKISCAEGPHIWLDKLYVWLELGVLSWTELFSWTGCLQQWFGKWFTLNWQRGIVVTSSDKFKGNKQPFKEEHVESRWKWNTLEVLVVDVSMQNSQIG